jgi:serine/threonine protein kinase
MESIDVIHRDMKPENVFPHQIPDARRGQCALKPVVGDFCLALNLKDARWGNPHGLRGFGTRGFVTPECDQKHYDVFKKRRLDTSEEYKRSRKRHSELGAKTKIWSIGAIALLMADLIGHPETPQTQNKKSEELENLCEIDFVGEKLRSPELTGLIKSCVSFEPDDRPTLQELGQKLKQHKQ